MLVTPNVVKANVETMSDKDFKQIVCSYILEVGAEGKEAEQAAITEVYSITKSVTSNTQKNQLKKMVRGQINTKNFCADIEV